MGKVDTSQFQGHLMGQIIAAVVGSLLLIFDDFAGYYFRGYSTETRAYIYLGSTITATLIILVGIAGLAFALYYAVQNLQAKDDMSPMTLIENTRKSMLGGAFTAALAGVGAIAFIITSLDTDWWLDSGFYGAFFGGLLIAVFAKLMLDKIEV